jgi:cytochrome c oxidase assembly protein subunit 15
MKKLSTLRFFNWLVLIFIYLVVVAGSFVRVTGSGMGCPDWPKCFGQWIPPTDDSNLPADYREHYSEGRIAKVEKFAKLLRSFGMDETATKILKDPNLVVEQSFNASKTWTEYVNRLFGFLAGNGMLIAFIWLLLIYRKRKLILLSILNLILIAFQAWFGSIVVASNLVPWTITVHLFLALVIIALQLLLIHWQQKETNHAISYQLPKWMNTLIIISATITIYQLFLGTQVREMIDQLTIQGFGRESWSEQLGLPFYIHRSFSWLVLIFIVLLAFKNEKLQKIRPLRWLFIVLSLELISGVMLAYGNLPGLVQISHLVFATILFGIFTLLLFRLNLKKARN